MVPHSRGRFATLDGFDLLPQTGLGSLAKSRSTRRFQRRYRSTPAEHRKWVRGKTILHDGCRRS